MRNKWKEWKYTLTKTKARRKIKRLTHKAERRNKRKEIRNYLKGETDE